MRENRILANNTRPAPRRQPGKLRIVSNHGAENDTLERLMRDLGIFENAGLDVEFIKVHGPSKNVDSLVSGEAELCAVSALNPLPDIERGAPVKIVGSAMKRPALALFARDPSIQSVRDLKGRSVGVGPRAYVLHMTVLALLRQNGIEAADVRFVEIGGNAGVFQAVASGDVDAGPSSVAAFALAASAGVHALEGGLAWDALPDFTYQTMYASDQAILQERETLVQAMASYSRLFDYLQSADSREAYLKARATATRAGDLSQAQAVWAFVQRHKPYGHSVAIDDSRLAYMQDLAAWQGSIRAPMPNAMIADMSLAADASSPFLSAGYRICH